MRYSDIRKEYGVLAERSEGKKKVFSFFKLFILSSTHLYNYVR
jgi:hypothetical protein